MVYLTDEAKTKLTEDQAEFVEMLGTLKGEIVYKSGFTISIYERVFDMLFENDIDNDYLSEIILSNTDNSLVGKLTADYVLAGYTDFTELRTFVQSKMAALISE